MARMNMVSKCELPRSGHLFNHVDSTDGFILVHTFLSPMEAARLKLNGVFSSASSSRLKYHQDSSSAATPP